MPPIVCLSLFYNRCTTPYCACPCLLSSWFLGLSHLYSLTPTIPCGERGAVSTHTHTHTHTFTQMFTHYTITHTDFTVSHDCLLQTIRAKSDLLQHLCVSHYLSVIPHLCLSSSTPAAPRFHCSCLVLHCSL